MAPNYLWGQFLETHPMRASKKSQPRQRLAIGALAENWAYLSSSLIRAALPVLLRR
jgi:hypothetical protein